ncbi:MAG: DUF4974 domain-containing protein [Cytophagales bacterium]|nr:DUF4974 domain-containing protein [Cytophagales bacterium]
MNLEPDHNDQLAKWLSGELSHEERTELEKHENLNDLKAVIEDIDSWSLPSMDIDSSHKKLLYKRDNQTPSGRVISMRPIWRVAAAVAFLTIAYFGWDAYDNQLMKYATGIGETQEITLPDGSVINLDAESKLNYSREVWKTERTVELSGQAYFAVVKKKKRFKVKTKKKTVRVKGTEFNIKSSDKQFEVICYSGSVQVVTESDDVTLSQGDAVRLVNSALISFTTKEESPDWQQGFSNFEDVPLSLVVEELKRYYEVKIELPEEYSNLKYTGRFVHNNLAQALRSIFTPMEINYKLNSASTVDFS